MTLITLAGWQGSLGQPRPEEEVLGELLSLHPATVGGLQLELGV